MMTEDLSIFFNTNEFASTATVGSTQFPVILDRDWAEVNGVEGYYPLATCRTADIAAVVTGTNISIDGTMYQVISKRPDGTGISQMVLEVV